MSMSMSPFFVPRLLQARGAKAVFQFYPENPAQVCEYHDVTTSEK